MTLLTPAQVAEMTQLTVETVQEKCRVGELRATKPAGRWRIYPDALEEWLRACEPEPGVVTPATAPRKLARDRGFRALVGGANG